MISLQGLRTAISGLGANKLRSALTMLGIMIGVGAVIVLVAVGTGSSRRVAQNIDRLGTNTLTVFRGGFRGGRGGASARTQAAQLTMADVKALSDKQQVPHAKSVSPTVNASAALAYQGTSYTPGEITGTTPTYPTATNFKIAAGTFFTDSDVNDHRKVIVLGQTVVDNLFPGVDPVGKVVTINGNRFTIDGTLQPKGSTGFQNQDDVAFVPITTMQDTLTGAGSLSGVTVQATSRADTTAAQAEVTQVLNEQHNLSAAQSSFQVLNQASLLQTSNDTNRVLTVLLGAVAAISLLVGGIGIMNIMLVTVTERTREIGIRKAVGARRADILRQFVLEAVLLSVLGGLVGVAAGLIGSQFRIVGVHPVVAPYSVALAFGFAVAVGLFFGIYPANRAATLKPIDALRFE